MHPTTPPQTPLVLEPADIRPTLLLKAARAKRPPAIPPHGIRALALARLEAAVQLAHERRRHAPQAVVAVAVPALAELQRQRAGVRVLVVAESDLQVLHALVGREQGVVCRSWEEGDLVGEDEGAGADDAVAGVEPAGLVGERDGT